MEYSVGSLAELISGLKTPNKQKVIAKKVKPEKKINGSKKLNETENETNTSSHTHKNAIRTNKKRELLSDVVERYQKNYKKLKDEENGIKLRKSSEGNQSTVLPQTNNGKGLKIKKEKLSRNTKNAERRIKQKIRTTENPEENDRTIFVGNVPLNVTKKDLKKVFNKYGPVESIRIRGVPVPNLKTPKKVAAIKKEFHPDRNNVVSFIKFENKEDAIKAQQEDGTLFHDHHIRVQHCGSENKIDESKAIFVGNLSFDTEEDELWKIFESCGPIASVRIVRDKLTRMGKGFAYVNFQQSDGVLLALEMENVQLKNRELRISLCNNKLAKKNKRRNKIKNINRSGKPRKFDKNQSRKSDDGQQQGIRNSTDFQGSKFPEKKKKNKVNKDLLHKKKIAKQLVPRHTVF